MSNDLNTPWYGDASKVHVPARHPEPTRKDGLPAICGHWRTKMKSVIQKLVDSLESHAGDESWTPEDAAALAAGKEALLRQRDGFMTTQHVDGKKTIPEAFFATNPTYTKAHKEWKWLEVYADRGEQKLAIKLRKRAATAAPDH